MKIKNFKIGGILIGRDTEPFIIAEMSGNHNQSLDRSLKIVEQAANAGAHALKLQTYTADTITLDVRQEEFVVNDKKVFGMVKPLPVVSNCSYSMGVA